MVSEKFILFSYTIKFLKASCHQKDFTPLTDVLTPFPRTWNSTINHFLNVVLMLSDQEKQ